MQKIICFAGASGSGKTALIEKLIPCLKSRGYTVGAVKHAHHGFEIDHKGKDSFRFFHAGCDSVAVSSQDKFSYIAAQEEELPVQKIMNTYMQDVDIVLVEGYKESEVPKIEVLGQGETLDLYKSDKSVIAVVSAKKVDTDLPQFNRNSIQEIAEFVMSF